MKKTSMYLSLLAGLCFAAGGLFGAAANEVTITGEGMCAKCERHETAQCQTAIEATENGKKVVYYLAANDVSKKFHKNICEDPAKVTATGVVEMKDGKHVLTVSHIELAK